MPSPANESLKNRINRLRARAGGRPVAPQGVPVRRKRVSRRETEARRQRLLRIGLAVAGIATVAVLVAGVLWDQVIKPNQTLATVGDVSISRQDYWKVRANDLFEQAQQYQDFAQFVGPQQQGQYLAMAEQSMRQLPEVWGSTDVDPTSLQKMIDDQVYLQGLPELGIELTPDEIRTHALNRFAPPNAPLVPARVTPTMTAERAAIATSTAAALYGTPVGTPGAATPSATVAAMATPVAGTPGATPIASPIAAATPNPTEARATAEAGFSQFEDVLFPVAHLTQADYDRLIAAPALARQEVREALADEVGQSAPQVRAAHILVPTQEAAEAARERIVDGGESFADVAKDVSTDQGTAANGGELGWFVREEMVPHFSDAAFALEPGEISQPVQSEFGWHIIQVEEKDSDQPMTDAQINRIEQALSDQWLTDERAALNVTSSLPPTPTPFPSGFQAPVGAPPPPTPTMVPGTPVG